MTTLTDLGQRRQDTTAVHQAARALRAGCRPEQVAAFLAAYCGLPLERDPEPPLPGVEPGWIWDDSEAAGEIWMSSGVSLSWPLEQPLPKRRWWQPKWSR